MAFELSKELTGGYELTARLQELLGRPLDSSWHEQATAVARELSRVFMVCLFMLKSPEGVQEEAAKIPKRTASIGSISNQTKHKCPRREGVTKTELTWTPYADGYQWRKYGQKRIQNSNFRRHYYRCAANGRGHHCPATKYVQQQDSSGSPMFRVTYVHEHTCDLASNSTTTSFPTSYAPRVLDFTIDSAQENEAIISSLITVISGRSPSGDVMPGPTTARPSDLPTYVGAGSSSSFHGSMADEMMTDQSFLYNDVPNMDALFTPRLGGLDVSGMVMDPTWLQHPY